jgi:DUF2075 family protein
MIVYEGSVEEFNILVSHNQIADKIAENFRKIFHYLNEKEYRAWQYSLSILNYSFINARLKDNYLIIEYQLPYSSSRIDVLLFGKNKYRQENIVILELKQWSNEEVDISEYDGNIKVNYGNFIKETPHPSLQVQGYYFYLKDFKKIFDDRNAPFLYGISYLHNYSKLKDKGILSEKYKEFIKKYPVFTKEDSIDLANYLREKLVYGEGKIVYERFINSPITPSKKLLDHTSKMIYKRQIFNLVEEQITAYNIILKKVKELDKTNKKSVIIIKGGPGTGKSVIALEIMGEMLRQGKKVMHATGSSAFTNTLRNIVGSRARNLFKFFNSFIDCDENFIDILICDEAHRIRETSSNRFKKSNLPQIYELLRVAKISVFFIDEYQIVRPKEIGSIDLIKKAAWDYYKISPEEIPEIELVTQFRCSGSDAYLQWLDNVLKIRQSEFVAFDTKMEFKIFDDPGEMMDEIRKRNKEKPNCARIVAGYCWPWSDPLPDGSLVKDVKIGNFEMPWENKKNFWKWATFDEGMEQVGTVYTAQGFEFDYIAVIFANDLVYDPNVNDWKAIPENSYDTEVKRNNPNLLRHLKSVYRVLLSRAHKGVYVYFMDKNTENYFRKHLKMIKKS